jgi:tryptophan 2,3-dioxygenase
MNYSEYLKLDTLLSAQRPLSTEKGRPAHDELLFISVHHTYEIWFKQLLFELDSILGYFRASHVAEKDMGTILARLQRMNEIMKILVLQVDVLETMTPMDFLEFRDLIYSASGFQSFQFRIFENKLGLRSESRLNYNSQPYYAPLSAEHAALVQNAEKEASLFECIEKWLSRTPYLEASGFRFWEEYQKAVQSMFLQDQKFINDHPQLSADERNTLLQNVDRSQQAFVSLFDEQNYEKMRAEGEWRLSYKAVHAALLIQLYREQPVFQLPFRLLTAVLNLDSQLTQWRQRHVIMVKKMLGFRIGTGGSSGAKYLRESAEQHKIFEDFYKLTTFFIPSSKRPQLPAEFEDSLGFARLN